MLRSRYIYLIALLSLTACGGGETPASKEKTTSSGESTQPVGSPTVDLSGQSGTSISNGAQFGGSNNNGNAAVDDEFSNAVGTLRHISADENVQGNLTLGATASDEDILKKVSLYLPKVARAFTLCDSNCPANFQATITGFNPQLADVVAGPLRIELIVEDNLGHSAIVDALSINWKPIQISAINASRANGTVSVSWEGNSSIQRYNVYAATEHGITAFNALELNNGIQRLAIKGTSVTFTDSDPSKDFHLLITGIDNGGESGKSSPYIIPRIVGAVNQPPVANNENFQVNEDESITVNVLENDVDPEGQLLLIESILQQPINGSLDYDDAGNFTYQGNVNFNGIDSVSYRIWDTEGATAEATVFFEILAVNDNPIAVDDTYGVDPSGKVSANDTNVLNNDSDIDGDQLQVSTTPVTEPQLGTVNINADGSFSYQSTSVLTTSDTFVYQVSDGNGGTANATVTILPNGNILPPIAQNDLYQVNEDQTLIINNVNQGILANDTDPNGLAFTLQESLLIEPAHGQLNLSLDGTFTYIPNSNFSGVDQFQYQIKNSADILAQAFVSITVLPVADDPIAQDDNYVTEEDVRLIVDASSGLLINDVDFDGSSLSVNTTPVSPPQKGTLVLAADGSFSYMPNADFSGVDSFTYQIRNAEQLTDTANVNIVILPSNDAPTVIDDSVTINEDTTAIVDVLANDSDVDSDDISLGSVTTENGSALIVNGKVQIAPALNFFGQYNVAYTARDSFGASSNGNLVVTVLPVNDAPLAVNDSYSLLEDAVLNILVSDTNQLLSNDSDIDGDTLTVNTTPVSNVSNGTLTLSSNGSFVYTPSVNFNGTDSFTYQVSDGNGGTAQASVTLTVNSLNDIPVPSADSFTIDEDNVLTKLASDSDNLLSNDIDADGDTLTVNTSPISNVSNGSLTLNSDGSFVYTPSVNFNGTDGFTYQVSDGNGGTANASVSLTVNSINDIPVVVGESYSIDEDTSLTKLVTDSDHLLINDSDVDGDTLTVNTTPVSNVSNGTLTLSSNGSFVYTPSVNFNGTDSFTYQVSDGNGGTAQASVTLTVNSLNDIPVPSADSFTIDEDNVLTKLVSDSDNLLSNDNDADGDTLTVNTTPISNVSNGSLTLNSDGSFVYTPSVNFNGTDGFTYQVSDGNGGTANASVSLTVNSINDIPVLADDDYSVDEDAVLSVLVSDSNQLLSNDSDVDGDTLTVNTTPVSNVSNGTLTLNSNGAFVYMPSVNFNGTDSFTYQVSDGNGGTAQASVTLTVNSLNDIPVAFADSFTLDEDIVLTKLVSDSDNLLSNDIDADGDTLTVNTTPISNVSNGSLTLNSDGSFVYTPSVNFNGTDSFTYQVSDGNGGTANASVNLTINSINDIPVLADDDYSVDEDAALSVLVSDSNQLLSNDSDVDGDTLTVNTTPVSNVSNGTLTLSSNGSFVYTPSVNFNGTDSFTYQVTDGNGGTAQASVTLTVNSINDIPVPSADNFSVDEDNVLTKLVSDSDNLLDNDNDADGDTLTVNTTPISNVSNGSLTLNSDGSFVYTPSVNFNGTDGFTYQVSDGNGGTANASVSLTINAINDLPVVSGESYGFNEDNTLTKLVSDSDNLLSNATDVDGDTLSVNTTAVADVNDGTLTLNSDGSFIYVPDADFNGTDSFTYEVLDGNGGKVNGNVSLTINALNDAPLAVNDSYSFNEDFTWVRLVTDGDQLLSNDSDIDGDTLTVNTTPITNVTDGTLTLNSDGSFTYVPDVNFNGTDSFVYQISDGNGETAQATANLIINAINDAPVVTGESYTFNEDITLTKLVSDTDNLLSNASDVDGDTLTVNTTAVTDVNDGSLTLNSDGSFTYIPDANFNGSDSFTYQVLDGNGGTINGNVSLTINAVNDLPTTVADAVSLDEDVPLAITFASLLANDSDIDGDTLTVDTSAIPTATKGVLTVSGSSFIYTPTANLNGTDSFTYKIDDGSGTLVDGTVNLTINAINDLPTTGIDALSLDEDDPLTITFASLLANDNDIDGDTLTVDTSAIPTATKGVLTVSGSSFIYTPTANVNGTDSFTYKIDDGSGTLVDGTVNLTINAINDLPTTGIDALSLDEDDPLTITFASLLANDNDIDGDTLTVDTSAIPTATKGVLTVSGSSFIYTPTANVNGTDSFTYKIDDGSGTLVDGTVNLTINAINDLPTTGIDALSLDEDDPLTITFATLLANDNDIDGDTLTVDTSAIPTATKGVLTVSGSSFIYTPTANLNGTDSFTYKIDDGSGTLVAGTVNLTINAVNDNPTPVNDSYTFDEDVTLTKLVSDGDNLLGNDTDIDGDSLSVNSTPIVDVSNGSLTLSTDGSFTYVPTPDFFGADSFAYQVSDGNGGTANAIVNLTIQAVNDAPQASPQTFNVDEDKTEGDAVGTVIATDKEGDTLTFSLTAGDTGLFQIDANTGAITVKGTNPLDFETTPQHSVTVTIDDDGSPIAESTDVVITIDVNDVTGDETITEVAGFGRAVLGSLELTGIKTQAQFNDSVRDGSKVYFIGSIDNVDKDVIVVAYDTNGTLDTGFGTNGTKTFDFGANEYGKAIVLIGTKYFLTFERDDGDYREVCFIKIDNNSDIDVTFGDNGLRCTGEETILTINDAVDIIVPAVQGDAGTEIPTIFAVGKVQGPTDDDLLVIRVDEDGNFQTSTTFVNNVEVVYSPHIMLDITGLGLDDEGIAVYNPHNNEAMIAGNVLTADGDYDIFAWIFNPKNADGNYVKFNNSTPTTYDVGGIGADDKVGGIDGENTGAAEHTAHIAGSTVLANGEQDAFIIELDSYAAYVATFGTGGVAIYDIDGAGGSGSSEFTGYTYSYADDNLYLAGNLFDGSHYQPFATRVFLDGSVDTLNYGSGGYQVVDYGTNAYASAMSIDGAERLWVPGYVESGSDTNMVISAFDSNGAAFNINDFVNGKNTITHSSTPSDDIVAEVIQIQTGAQSGKFLVAATADDGINKHIILTRFTSAGLLDTSFNSDDHKQVKIGTSAEVKGLIEVQANRVIVYGDVTEAGVTNGFIARIDQNGVLDTTFATNGIYTTAAFGATNIHFNQVKADSTGRLIAVGNHDDGSKSALVLRLTTNGALDLLFNTLGTQGYVVGANTDDYFAVLIDSSDNIYAGGNRNSGNQDMLLVKYLATGLLDVTLDTDGILTVDIAGGNDNVEFLGFDSSNDIYMVGNEIDRPIFLTDHIAVVKTSTAGILDNSFSSDGKARFSMTSLSDSGMRRAAIDSNNNIVVVGYSDSLLLGSKRHMIGRITPAGSLDNTFDLNGWSRVDTCSNSSQLESVILLNNSSFIVAGQCYIDGTETNNIDLSHYQLN